MIPQTDGTLTIIETVESPSMTYGIDFDRNRMTGYVDNEEAILQAVRKLLNTERYSYVIYTSQYGIELNVLIGQDYDYVVSAITSTLAEALLVDDRITGVNNVVISKVGVDSMEISFIVNSVFGDVNVMTEVLIG